MTWLSAAKRQLAIWLQDWIGRSEVAEPEGSSSISPIEGIIQATAILGTIFLKPILNLFDVNSPNAVFIFRSIAIPLLIGMSFYVVTAKRLVNIEERGPVTGTSVTQVATYRYGRKDRGIARAIVGLLALVAIVALISKSVPEARDCHLVASFSLVDRTGVEALYFSLNAGNNELARLPPRSDGDVAVDVPSTNVSAWSLVVVWSDDTISEVGPFSGCPATERKGSDDGLVQVELHTN